MEQLELEDACQGAGALISAPPMGAQVAAPMLRAGSSWLELAVAGEGGTSTVERVAALKALGGKRHHRVMLGRAAHSQVAVRARRLAAAQETGISGQGDRALQIGEVAAATTEAAEETMAAAARATQCLRVPFRSTLRATRAAQATGGSTSQPLQKRLCQ